jgi:hypothetical protein
MKPALTPQEELAGLRELLAQRQELDLLQSKRIEDLERELGEAHAKLRVADAECQRLRTQVTAFTKNFPPATTPAA